MPPRETSADPLEGIPRVVWKGKMPRRSELHGGAHSLLGDKVHPPTRHRLSARPQCPSNPKVAMGKAKAQPRVTGTVKNRRVMITLSCKRFTTAHRCPACSTTIWRKVRGNVSFCSFAANAPLCFYLFQVYLHVNLFGLILPASLIAFVASAGSGRMTVEQKRMEEVAKRAAQRAVNQLRMSRHARRAGAGQVKPNFSLR